MCIYYRFLYKIIFNKNLTYWFKSPLYLLHSAHIYKMYLFWINYNCLLSMNIITKIYFNKFKNKYIFKIRRFFVPKKLYYYRYNWCFYNNFFKIKSNLEFTQFFRIKKKKSFLIKTFVESKKDTGFFKKYFNLKRSILHRFKKIIFGKRFLLKFSNLIRKQKNFQKNYRGSLQNIDFTNRSKIMYYNNRKIIQYFILNKKRRQSILSKFLRRFIHQNSINYINYLEYSLTNIILKSQFFNTQEDVINCIKNSQIIVNNRIVSNPYYNVNEGDIIKIIYPNYYIYYRRNLHNLIKNSNKIGFSFRKLNRVNKAEVHIKNVKTILLKTIYLNKDVPSYLDVDYINMTISLIYKTYNYMNLTYLNKKFLNFYLTRLYNWKYIT